MSQMDLKLDESGNKLFVPPIGETMLSGQILQKACHHRAVNNGWWNCPETGRPVKRSVPELLCLIHSEVSEALEGYRKGLKDDHLTHRDMVEVELADAAIRIFDMAGGLGYNLGDAIAEKLEYNDNRADHKPENRAKAGGKKI